RSLKISPGFPALHNIAGNRSARIRANGSSLPRDNHTKFNRASAIMRMGRDDARPFNQRLIEASQMSNQLTVQQSNLPADLADEADALLASTQTHEKLLKFRKGKYFVMDDEVRAGTEFIAHASQLTLGWVKFVGNKVVERKMGRAADRFAPPERNELGDM